MRFSRPLLQLPIRFDAAALAADVAALPRSAWVPHPQGFAGNDAVPLISVNGGLNDEFSGPMAATEHLRRLPYVSSLMQELGGVWGRSRLMGLGPGAVVPAHVDIHYYWRTHIRIHIPVVTNPGVRFHCGGESVHMEPGEAWVFDSFQTHEVRNEGREKRIHLVLDTVGSARIWDLIEAANSGTPVPASAWQRDGQGEGPALRFEQMNQPLLISPWEIRCHVDYLLEHVEMEVPQPILQAIERFIFNWHAAWAEHGESEAGSPIYRELVQAARQELTAMGSGQIILTNEAPLYRALDALIFSRALMPTGPNSVGALPKSPKAA